MEAVHFHERCIKTKLSQIIMHNNVYSNHFLCGYLKVFSRNLALEPSIILETLQVRVIANQHIRVTALQHKVCLHFRVPAVPTGCLHFAVYYPPALEHVVINKKLKTPQVLEDFSLVFYQEEKPFKKWKQYISMKDVLKQSCHKLSCTTTFIVTIFSVDI